MHIAIFTDYYLPSHGGVQSSIYAQKLLLERHGHKVTVVAPYYPKHSDNDDRIALRPTITINYGGHTERVLLPFPTTYWKLRRVLARYEFDIVHIQSEHGVALFGLKAAGALGIPIVYTAHTLLWKQAELGPKLITNIGSVLMLVPILLHNRGSMPVKRQSRERLASYVFRSLVASYAKSARVTITPSSHLKAAFTAWGLRGEKHNFTNFVFDQRAAIAPPDITTFLWVGRLDKEKRPLHFVKAIQQLAESTTVPFAVKIVGTGEFLETIKTMLAPYPQVEFFGGVPYADIRGYYDAASALVLSSHGFDNQPMTIVEAISHERPVILQDKYLTDGLKPGAALFSDDASAEALSRTMQQFLEDDTLRQEAFSAAQASKLNFSSDHAYERLIAVYESACSTSGDTRST